MERDLISLSIAGGEHDYLKWSIGFDSMALNDVAIHERQHAYFINRSEFGLLQQICRAVILNSNDESVRSRFRQWATCLHTSSIEAHEAFATYCGVKAFKQNQHPGIIKGLHENPHRRFQKIAEWLDDVWESTYIQMLVAQAVGIICLSPDIISRFIQSGFIKQSPALQPSESPNRRLGVIIETLPPRIQLDLFLETKNRLLKAISDLEIDSRFDLGKESDWENLEARVSLSLEQFLFEEVDILFYREISKSLPISKKEKLVEHFKELLKVTSRESGVQLDLSPLAQLTTPDLSSIEYIDSQYASISNDERPGLTGFKKLPKSENIYKLLDSPPGKKVIVTSSHAIKNFETGDWYLVSMSENAYIKTISFGDLKKYIETLQQNKLIFDLNHEVDAIVIGIESLSDFNSISRSASEIHDTLLSRNHSHSIQLFWYMQAGLGRWLAGLNAMKGTQGIRFPIWKDEACSHILNEEEKAEILSGRVKLSNLKIEPTLKGLNAWILINDNLNGAFLKFTSNVLEQQNAILLLKYAPQRIEDPYQEKSLIQKAIHTFVPLIQLWPQL